jgi:hypothetical protein
MNLTQIPPKPLLQLLRLHTLEWIRWVLSKFKGGVRVFVALIVDSIIPEPVEVVDLGVLKITDIQLWKLLGLYFLCRRGSWVETLLLMGICYYVLI